MRNIGIVGFGFLGRAIAHGFSLHSNIKIYDKYDEGYDSLEDTVHNSDFIFICVPTPMKDNGEQDLAYMHDAIFNVVTTADDPKVIILKSTIVPGTTRFFAGAHPGHEFVHNPEFLTQRVAKLDFINQSRIILGGEKTATSKISVLYRDRFPHTPIYETTWEGAEVSKYMVNCFFALKVSFCNEMYDIAEHIGIPYEELRNMWLSDQRIGNSHHDVPGHDGDRGYGGKCFPKDVEAFICWAREEGVDLETLKAAVKVNNRVRTDKDWEHIKGATSNCKFDKGGSDGI